MEVVIDHHGVPFRGKAGYISSSLRSDVTVENLLGPIALVHARACAGCATEEAVKAKEIKYGGAYRPTYKLIPLAFSASGEYSTSVQGLTVRKN